MAEETHWLQMPQEERARHTKPSMQILVTGKTGTGKSSLIDSILDQEVTNVSDGANPQKHEPIEVYRDHVFGGHSVKVADTRGLGDPDVSSESILESIKKELADSSDESFDLVLICIRLDDRIDENTIELMKKIASVCGSGKFWERVVIVLTFTNMFEAMLKAKNRSIQKDELVEKIVHKIEEISTKLKSCIPGVPFEKIPHICAGWNFQEGKLSTSDDWRRDLFFACLQRCSKKSKPVMESLIQQVLGVTALSVSGAMVGAGIGAAVGAAVGTIFFPGVGTAAGALTGVEIGALYGAVTGTVSIGGVTAVATTLFLNKQKS